MTRPRVCGSAASWTIARARVVVTPMLRPQAITAVTTSHQAGSIQIRNRTTTRESWKRMNQRPGRASGMKRSMIRFETTAPMKKTIISQDSNCASPSYTWRTMKGKAVRKPPALKMLETKFTVIASKTGRWRWDARKPSRMRRQAGSADPASFRGWGPMRRIQSAPPARQIV